MIPAIGTGHLTCEFAATIIQLPLELDGIVGKCGVSKIKENWSLRCPICISLLPAPDRALVPSQWPFYCLIMKKLLSERDTGL